MHSLDTVEYYLQASEIDGECYQLLAYVSGDETGHVIAKRSTFKRIEAIHDYIMARGFVTIADMENGQRILRTFPRLDRLENRIPRMIVVFAADHAGVALKTKLLSVLADQGIMTLDLGAHCETSVDYPDYAFRVCEILRRGIDYGCVGVLICGTGIGMSMAANRHPHIRCAVVTNVAATQLARRHNDANVLALGARVVDEDAAIAILDAFLSTQYEGGRHDARLAKLCV